MKISEVQKMYSAQLNQLWEQKTELLKKQKKQQSPPNHTTDQSVTLELSAIDEQYRIVGSYMEELLAYKTALHNSEVAKQQGEVLQEYAQDMAKCTEIARRISNGDKVPASDEQKLLNYNFEIYAAAKNMAAMNSDRPHKEYHSLWEEEDTKCADRSEKQTASEIVDDTEYPLE